MQYDIFLSCKSEDYEYAEEIYKYLQTNGFQVFLAPEELRKLGESEYRKAISKALKSAYHMIVFASKAEHIDSEWVYYEWDWFVNAILNKRKKGQIVTILKDLNTNEINEDLLKYESFNFLNYKKRLLPYVETPQYKLRKKEIQEKEQEEKLKKRAECLSKVIDLAEDYRKRIILDAKDITTLLRKIGKRSQTCPVCELEVDMGSSYCPNCGWTISPVDNIEGADYLSLTDPSQLDKAKSVYKKSIELVSQRDDLTRENRALRMKEAQLDEQIENLKAQVSERVKDLNKAIQEGNKLKENNSELVAKNEALEKDNTALQTELNILYSKLDELQLLLKEKEHKDFEMSQHKKINLGLSVCWAEHNVGASVPEEFGSYFAWGEVESKEVYSKDNYVHYNAEKNRYVDIGREISNTDYDAAHCIWGKDWRLPTLAEMRELEEKCVWTFVTQNNQKGYKIVGPNGNSIFLPAAGHYVGDGLNERIPSGNYMSGTLKEGNQSYCYYFYFHNGFYHITFYSRQYGFSIRPVSDLKDNIG